MFDAILQAKYLCLTSKRKTRPPLAYLRINLINHWNLTSSPRSSGKNILCMSMVNGWIVWVISGYHSYHHSHEIRFYLDIIYIYQTGFYNQSLIYINHL